MPVDVSRTPLAGRLTAHKTALLIVDMISTWDFPDAEKLAPSAVSISSPIAALKRRCARAGIAVIYVNDNRGRWRSDFRELTAVAEKASLAGAEIARNLTPTTSDYSVLKPKHSAFYATPLDLLLRHLKVQRLIVTGVTADMCIASSAAEARMRDYAVLVPRDCVAALSPGRTARALKGLVESHNVKTTPSSRIRLVDAPPAHPARREPAPKRGKKRPS